MTAQPELTPAELDELNELAQRTHHVVFMRAGLDFGTYPFSIKPELLARALDDYARLRIEVMQLRALLAELSDDAMQLQRESD